LFILNVVVWLTVLGLVFYWIAARSLEKQVEDSLNATAAVLASQWDGTLLLPLKSGMEDAALYSYFVERLQRLRQQTRLEGIYIARPDRTNIVSTDKSIRIGQSLPRLDLMREELQQALEGKTSASRLIRVNRKDYKSSLAPIYAQDRVVAVLMVDISPAYLEYLKTFRTSLMLFAITALICCVWTARLFSKTITTPIARMAERVEEIGKAKYEQPMAISGSDELSHLAAAIETMRQNILHRDLQMKMMLSGIAHEIRNPLGGIELFAGILEKEQLDRIQLEYIQKIQDEIQNLKKLLNEFLEFARPRTLERENVSLPLLLSEIETLFGEDIREKRARWNIEIQPGTGVVFADRLKLKQVLMNLYRNAVQSLPPSSGEVETRLRKNGAGIILEISNTQPHRMESLLTKKIFEPFFTTREKGMGLGLPLAKGIIEAHGGELRLTENEDSRITFAIKLPGEKQA